jgi:rhodanese-related sulfurtransferase
VVRKNLKKVNMNFIQKLFGWGPKADLDDLIKNKKAHIVDVRTPAEFRAGHVKGSENIPLSNIASAADKLMKKQPIVLCCASGNRSGQAASILRSKGLSEVYNGGAWRNVNRYKS